MAGPMVGITVRPRDGDREMPLDAPRRKLRLYANERAAVFGDRPGLGFILQDGSNSPAGDSVRIPGTPILLTRGEPTQITVFNRMRIPLSVHWHGMELQSYFDGVPDFSGRPGATRPAIAPGDSFTVHMTPPRAGTFMYHIHSEQSDELNSGLYGPLIVLEPGRTFDPEIDHIIVISNAGPGNTFQTIAINGKMAPGEIVLKAGVPQRFRFIAIPANGEYNISLNGADGPVQWRQVARDGAELPPSQKIARPAVRQPLNVGQIQDFEFIPNVPGDLKLEFDHRVPCCLTQVPIKVR